MSQIVTCPCGCNHVFEVDDRFEKYEKIVEKLTNGNRAKKGTKGYDVIGEDRTTYQVKYSYADAKDHRGWIWQGDVIGADFFVFFGNFHGYDMMFLLDKSDILPHATLRKTLRGGNTNTDKLHWMIAASQGFNGWMWNYRVTPETFMRRVAELKSIQQLSLEFTKGLGD